MQVGILWQTELGTAQPLTEQGRFGSWTEHSGGKWQIQGLVGIDPLVRLKEWRSAFAHRGDPYCHDTVFLEEQIVWIASEDNKLRESFGAGARPDVARIVSQGNLNFLRDPQHS